MRRYALAKVLRNIDLAAELGATTYVMWGGREGAESGGGKDVQAALDRYREALDLLCAYVRDQGYDLRFAIEPKPNEPRGDILLPTIGHALAFIADLDHPEMVGLNPEVGHEEMAGLNFAHGIAQALWHGKLFHVDLNGQHGPRFDQDLRFGAGNLRGRLLDRRRCSSGGTGDRRTTAPGTSTTSRRGPRTTTASGTPPPACMRNYLILRKERDAAFRADPEVRRGSGRGPASATSASRRSPPASPWRTCGPAATTSTALGAEQGLAFEALDQLAMEHLLGAR